MPLMNSLAEDRISKPDELLAWLRNTNVEYGMRDFFNDSREGYLDLYHLWLMSFVSSFKLKARFQKTTPHICCVYIGVSISSKSKMSDPASTGNVMKFI